MLVNRHRSLRRWARSMVAGAASLAWVLISRTPVHAQDNPGATAEQLCNPPPDGVLDRALCLMVQPVLSSIQAPLQATFLVILVVLAGGLWFLRDPLLGRVQQHRRRRAKESKLEAAISRYTTLTARQLRQLVFWPEQQAVPLDKVYIPLRGRRTTANGLYGQRDGTPHPLTQFLSGARRLIVVGRGGFGKSTFLQHIAATLAEAHTRPNEREALDFVRKKRGLPLDSLRVPIFIELRDFGYYITEVDPARPGAGALGRFNHAVLLDFMAWHYMESESSDAFDRAFFEGLLEDKHCMVFLDGLDEVPTTHQGFKVRDSVIEIVANFVRHFGEQEDNQSNRFVISCRPEAHRGLAILSDFEHVRITPLSDELVRGFARDWYHQVIDLPSTADHLTSTFLDQLQDRPQLRELTERPLLLTLLTVLHSRTAGELTASRHKLYERCLRVLLDEWESKRGVGGRELPLDLVPDELRTLEYEDRRQLLEAAAFWLMSEKREDEAPEAEWVDAIIAYRDHIEDSRNDREFLSLFLHWAATRGNVLEEHDDRVYSFTSRTAFQPYLAARYLESQEENKLALSLVGEPKWNEPLRLLAAILPGDQRLTFLSQALDEDATYGPLLVAQCLIEIDYPLGTAKLKKKTHRRLSSLVLSSTDIEVRARAGDWAGHPKLRPADATGDEPSAAAIQPELVEVPAGPFVFSVTQDAGGQDAHVRASIERRYQIGRFPVTVMQYERFIGSGGYSDSSLWGEVGAAWLEGRLRQQLPPMPPGRKPMFERFLEKRSPATRTQPVRWEEQRSFGRRPVTGVTWFEAMAYCRWLERNWEQLHDGSGAESPSGPIRLPTEGEWIKAARGGTTLPAAEQGAARDNPAPGRQRPWTDRDQQIVCNTRRAELAQPTAVGIFPDGDSPYRGGDMIGNVWEWCMIDPADGELCPLRGGSFDTDEERARIDERELTVVTKYDIDIGFRVVRAVE